MTSVVVVVSSVVVVVASVVVVVEGAVVVVGWVVVVVDEVVGTAVVLVVEVLGGRVVVVVLGGGATGKGRVVVVTRGLVVVVVDPGRLVPGAPDTVAVLPATVVSTPSIPVLGVVCPADDSGAEARVVMSSIATGAPLGSQTNSDSCLASPSITTTEADTNDASPGPRWSWITTQSPPCRPITATVSPWNTSPNGGSPGQE